MAFFSYFCFENVLRWFITAPKHAYVINEWSLTSFANEIHSQKNETVNLEPGGYHQLKILHFTWVGVQSLD